jgi:hypothetical protein
LSKKAFEHAATGGVHLIAQVKANQPALHHAVAELCNTVAPLDTNQTTDKKRRSRDETRMVEVFAPGNSLADTEWDGHIGAVIRVNRDVLTRSAITGLWRSTSETALFVSDVVLPAAQCAKAIHADADNEYAMLDSTIVRAHQHSAGAQKRRCGPGDRTLAQLTTGPRRLGNRSQFCGLSFQSLYGTSQWPPRRKHPMATQNWLCGNNNNAGGALPHQEQRLWPRSAGKET